MRRYLPFRLLGAAVIVATTAALAAPVEEPRFSDFPAGPAYRGAAVAPSFAGSGREWAQFRTRIREAMGRGVNFAGRFTLVQIGCGAGCSLVAIADLGTGRIAGFPLGGEENLYLKLRYRRDSRLVSARSVMGGRCIVQFFVWTGEGFDERSRAKLGDQQTCWKLDAEEPWSIGPKGGSRFSDRADASSISPGLCGLGPVA